MAGTISVQSSVNYSHGTDVYSPIPISFTVSVAGTARSSGVISVGTSEESVPLGDVSSVGIIVLKNLDATNYITVGTVTNQRGIRINAGESYPFRASNNGLFIAANTAACNVAYEIFSN